MNYIRLKRHSRFSLGRLSATFVSPKRCISGSQCAASPDDCDIAIVGGGAAGLALASALGSIQTIRESLRIVLIEAGDLSKVRKWAPPPRVFSNRVSSLTNVSQLFLEDIGAWDHLDKERICPIDEMQVWDGVSDARIIFNAPDLNLGNSSQMAFLAENLNLQCALLRSCSGIPEVHILDNVKVDSIQNDSQERGGWPLVSLTNGKILRTRLLVGADGFNSPVRSFAGISSYGWAYDTHAIVATLTHPARGPFQSSHHTAFQRFLPTGPIAFLPLSPTEASLVWSTKPHLARALTQSDPAILINMINAAFRLPELSVRYLHKRIVEAYEMGTPLTPSEVLQEISWRETSHGIDSHSAYASATAAHGVGIPPTDSDALPPLVTSVQPGSVAWFPLRFNHADAYLGEGPGSRTVLVGDAAHTVHPLAGQGLNMALADVECLTRCIKDAVLHGGDVGSITALQPYARERYFENHRLMSAIDKLHKLYSTTLEPVVWARSIGVEVLNEFDSVKAAIMMAAGGHLRHSNVRQRSSWILAAGAAQAMMAGLNTANAVKDRITDAAREGLRGLFREHQR